MRHLLLNSFHRALDEKVRLSVQFIPSETDTMIVQYVRERNGWIDYIETDWFNTRYIDLVKCQQSEAYNLSAKLYHKDGTYT